MKFLLAAVNAKYIHSNPAIYSLRADAGEALAQYTELAEYTINQSAREILADIYGRKPDAVGFSCYIWNWRLIEELLEELPKLLPGAEIWLGGPEVSYDASVILSGHPQITGIMLGEGEETFKELLTYYVRREEGQNGLGTEQTLKDIAGLCLPEGCTPCRPPVDMDRLPFLYRDLSSFENRIIYYESGRGCPFRCSYCLSSLDKRVRVRGIGAVKRELQFFLDHRVKQVKFVDRTFNCDHEHAMAVWTYLQENDNSVTNFHFEISADILREEEIAVLNRFRPGFVQLEIGVQSANPRTLEAVRRGTDMERLERAVAAIRRGGNVHLHLDLIAGLPYEGYESFGLSFDRVYGMKPDQLQLGFLKLLKGSPLWEKAAEYGICCQERPPYEVLHTRWLSYEEMLRLKRIEEMVELYYNSGQFAHTLAFLESAFPGPFALYESLADFCGRKGYFSFGPARVRRYQALLQFAREYDGERLEVYRELLTFDLYLREKVKSRPDFAGDTSMYKEAVRQFYQKEEKEGRYLSNEEGYDWKQLAGVTHLEPFAWPVWDRERMAAGYGDFREGKPREADRVFVLFDYRKRGPLDNGAKVWLAGPAQAEGKRGST